MSNQRSAKRQRWFDLGARAAASSVPILSYLPPCYICPLCFPDGRVFFEAALDTGELTLEHTPPKALGGRELMLTCHECNNQAGHTLDHEMLTLEQALDFNLGTLSQPARVRLKLGSQVLNAEMEAQGDNILIKGIPAANRRNIAELLKAEVDGLMSADQWEGTTLNIGFNKRLRHRPALVGWLRSAYLVAFAYFGYHYILDPMLRIVRIQLAEPNVEHIPIYSATSPDVPRTYRRLTLIREPKHYRSLLVQMGRHAVFLPSPEDTEDLYPRLASRLVPRELRPHTFIGKDLTWPNAPMYVMDLADSSA